MHAVQPFTRIAGRILGASHDWTHWTEEKALVRDGRAAALRGAELPWVFTPDAEVTGGAPAPAARDCESSQSGNLNEGCGRMRQDSQPGQPDVPVRAVERAALAWKRDACTAPIRAATETFGSLVRPASKSRSVVSGIPDSRDSPAIPIAARSSDICVRQGEVPMGRNLRESEDRSQLKGEVHSKRPRKGVLRKLQDPGMTSRDLEQEKLLKAKGVLPGQRIAYWRNQLGLSRAALGDKAGCSETAISDLESGKTKKGRHLPELARALGLAYDYVYAGKGEPHALNVMSPAPVDWPLPGLPRSMLEGLDDIEVHYLESKMKEALEAIADQRRGRRTRSKSG